MSRISRSSLLFLLIILLINHLVGALQSKRLHLCRKVQESVENDVRLKRSYNQCPTGKYLPRKGRQCRRCRNCTDVHRAFSKTCGCHSDAVCGQCEDSYFDEYSAESQAGDDSSQKPCQHCRFDETNSKKCSSYRAKLNQNTRKGIHTITTQQIEYIKNKFNGDKLNLNTRKPMQIITIQHAEFVRNNSKEKRVEGAEDSLIESDSTQDITLNVTLPRHLLLVLLIILIIYIFARMWIKIFKVFNKYPEQNGSIGRSCTNQIEEGYRSVSYAVHGPGRSRTKTTNQCMREGCMFRCGSDGNLKYPAVWTKTYVEEGMPLKHLHTDNSKKENANGMFTSPRSTISLQAPLSKEGLDGSPLSDRSKRTLHGFCRHPKRPKT